MIGPTECAREVGREGGEQLLPSCRKKGEQGARGQGLSKKGGGGGEKLRGGNQVKKGGVQKVLRHPP